MRADDDDCRFTRGIKHVSSYVLRSVAVAPFARPFLSLSLGRTRTLDDFPHDRMHTQERFGANSIHAASTRSHHTINIHGFNFPAMPCTHTGLSNAMRHQMHKQKVGFRQSIAQAIEAVSRTGRNSNFCVRIVNLNRLYVCRVWRRCTLYWINLMLITLIFGNSATCADTRSQYWAASASDRARVPPMCECVLTNVCVMLDNRIDTFRIVWMHPAFRRDVSSVCTLQIHNIHYVVTIHLSHSTILIQLSNFQPRFRYDNRHRSFHPSYALQPSIMHMSSESE